MKKLLASTLATAFLVCSGVGFADETRYQTNPNFPEGSFMLSDFRNNLRGFGQMDIGPLTVSANLTLDGMEWPTDATAQAEYSGTGVTITSDNSNEQEGTYSLKAVTDGTSNRSFERSIALDLSAYSSLNLWARSSATSDSIQFYIEDSGGDQSRWDFTTNSSADTWEEETLDLTSPDSNNGSNADLSDISAIGFRALSSSTTYYFDTTEAVTGMTVAVRGTNLGNYYRHVFLGDSAVSIDLQAAPTITAPSTNPRIDILEIDDTGALSWVTGTEASSPTVPWSSRDGSKIPIALVYQKTTMAKVVDFVDKDSNTNEGYIMADVRPFLSLSSNLRKGADVASTASMTLGNDGNFFDITGATTITSITAKPAGTVVWLQFDASLTVTDGSNLKLNGDFDTSAESVLQLVSDGTNWYEVSRQPTASTFLSMSDTPSSYSGQALKVVRVNAGQTGTEFHTPDFTDNDDTPSSYSGHGGKTVKVNSGETELEFVTADEPGYVLDDTDTITSGNTSKAFTIAADKEYMVMYSFDEPTSNTDTTINLRINGDSTSSYSYNFRYSNPGSSSTSYHTSSTGTAFYIGGLRRNSGNAFLRGQFHLSTFQNDDADYSVFYWGSGFGNDDSGGGASSHEYGGALNKNITPTSFTISFSSNITNGTIRVYALDQSL